MRNPTMFVLASLLAVACSDAEPKPDNADNGGADASSMSDAIGQSTDAASAADSNDPADFGIGVDVSPEPAYCDSVSSQGFFTDCTACDANGLDCDTIDSPGASGRACGCSAGACPCGLRCGDYEIGPNIVVGSICVR